MVLPLLTGFFVQLAVGIALMVIAFLIMPKPKQEQPAASRDLANPTAEAGRPVPVVFGTLYVKGGNVIDYMDKGKHDFEVNA